MFRKTSIVILVAFVIIIFLYTSNSKEIQSLEDVNLDDRISLNLISKKTDTFPSDYWYIPEINQVFDSNEDGELLGLLQRKDKPFFNKLYIINPAFRTANKVAETPSTYQIADAEIGKEWIVWVEKSITEWKIKALDRSSNVIKTIDQGEYSEIQGNDYPSIDLFNEILVFNSSIDKLNSHLIIKNLRSGNTDVIYSSEEKGKYIGPPSIYGNYITWHVGEWTKNMRSDIFLYDLASKNLLKIDTLDQAMMPKIWGNYIVFTDYNSSSLESKNIKLYEISSGSERYIAKASDKEEFWGPSISHGIISWNYNSLDFKPIIYSTSTQEKRIFEMSGQQVKVLGSWLLWRSKEAGTGICIIGLSNLYFLLDLRGNPSFTIVSPTINQQQFSEEDLIGLNPNEVLSIYLEAYKNHRFDIISYIVNEQEGLVTKKIYLDDVKASGIFPISFSISSDYLIEGIKALCHADIKWNEPSGVSDIQSSTFRLTKMNRVWKVDQLAQQ